MSRPLKWLLAGVCLAAAIAVAEPTPKPVTGAPLAQATATPTPRTISIAGQPMPCTDSSSLLPGTCTQRVDTGTGSTSIAGALPAGENHIGAIGGTTTCVPTTKTRPANTTAYVANAAISESTSAGTSWTFALGRVSGGTGTITNATVFTDNSANTAILQMDLYGAALGTALNDAAEATILFTNTASWLGQITWPALAKPTANSTVAMALNNDLRIPYKIASGTSVVGTLRTTQAFTPVSGANYRVIICAAQD